MSFFLTMFIGGPLLGYLLLRVAGVDGWAMRLLPAVSLLALVVSAMVALMQGLNWQPFTALFSRPLPWCRTTVR
jgi:DMSO reductase anchor subunit